MNKLLTGEILHHAYESVNTYSHTWTEVPQKNKEAYERMAKYINEELGMCESCGNRPVAPNVLLEVAGDMVCQKCCTPPQDDPKIQYMHLISNPDNTLAGVIVAPSGMSLEDFRKQLTEEMKDIHFILEFELESLTAKSMRDLYRLWDENIPVPSSTQTYEYSIHVMKDGKEVGLGKYKCATYDRSEVIKEAGAAEGLMDTIDEYAWIQIKEA